MIFFIFSVINEFNEEKEKLIKDLKDDLNYIHEDKKIFIFSWK